MSFEFAKDKRSTLTASGLFLLLCFVAPLNVGAFKVISFVVLLATCVAGLYGVLQKPQMILRNVVAGGAVFAFLFVWLIYHTQNGGSDLIWFIRYFSIFVVLLVCQEKLRNLIPSLLALGVVVFGHFLGNVYCVIFQQGMFLNGANRYFGLSDRMIVLSGIINFLCMIYCMMYLERAATTSKKTLCAVLVGLAMFNILMTSSRSTLVAGISFILWYRGISFRPSRIAMLVVGAAFFSLLLLTLSPELVERFSTTSDLSQGSNISRLQFMLAGMNMFAEHPWAGVGAGASHVLLEQHYVPWEESPSMHFDLLLIASEMGIFGLVALGAVLLKLKVVRPVPLLALFLLSTQNMFYYAPYLMLILLALSSAVIMVAGRNASGFSDGPESGVTP